MTDNFTTGGVHGVPEGEWDRGPQLREGDGLPGGAQLAGDLWGRACHVCKEGAAKRGEKHSQFKKFMFLKRYCFPGITQIDFELTNNNISRWSFQRQKEKSWEW